MMSLLPEGTFFNILAFVVTLVVVIIIYAWYVYGYWKRRNVPYLEPKFPLGNLESFLPKGVSIGVISEKFYNQFKSKGEMVGGVYIGMQPNLVILNPDYIKDILIKDFQNFTDRGIYHTESDPVTVNIFTQPGLQWKNARVKFTSIFTSAKIKAMFETILDCSEGLKGALEQFAEQKSDVDMLEVAACFTTDVIGSCVFGIGCNSFKDPDAEFRKMGRKFFNEFNLLDRLNLLMTICSPKFSQKLGVSSVQKDVSRFFIQSVQNTVSYREKHNVRRNDLMQLLIDMKNSEEQLSMDELAGQVFLFFVAGFETSSSTMNLTLFEVSRREDVQNKVREEILEVLSRYDNKITYDAIAEMKYLGQLIDETLRLWPPVSTITRVCTKDYTLKNSNITMEKGTPIIISAVGLHHDPEYWPEPSKWDPDRFSDENKDNIRPLTYLPFGDGPRNCIGLRFGLLQTKIGLITVLSKYRVSLSPKTVTPLGADPVSFVLVTKNRVYLRLEKI